MEKIVDEGLNDLERQILNEEISYQFYDKAVNSVEYIGPQKQFKEMMWEEFNHVKLLREKYTELGGKKDITYDFKQHGGLIMPSKEIDTETALDIGIKEERESIGIYNTLSIKYKDENLSQLFSSLLKDEKKHLSAWQNAQICYLSENHEPLGESKIYPTYRLRVTDLKVIEEVINYWKRYYKTFVEKAKSLNCFSSFDVIFSILKKQKGYLGLIENEYFRLKDIKPYRIDDLVENPTDTINTENNSKNNILEEIINNEKDCLIRVYDWSRRCTNSQLQELLWNIMEDKYSSLKQLAKFSNK